MTERRENSRELWNEIYSEREQMWSGKPNASLVTLIGNRAPSTVLDLGCGEGGDVLWLAAGGWQATGIDISDVAVGRARDRAATEGLEATFIDADLTDWTTDQRFDLIITSFLQSHADFDRIPLLSAALNLLAPGGELISVAHAGAPSFADPEDARKHRARMVEASEEARVLADGRDDIEVVLAEEWTRDITSPAGEPATIPDAVMVLRKNG
ncbi:class I SAM-dependent methyltransferase [Rothia nasimurium]|uniref:class I SAM-dependent methyltransferase n=1 Tax=Rothia nasimurium TaxID=85336 RepID=UPI003B9FB5DE